MLTAGRPSWPVGSQWVGRWGQRGLDCGEPARSGRDQDPGSVPQVTAPAALSGLAPGAHRAAGRREGGWGGGWTPCGQQAPGLSGGWPQASAASRSSQRKGLWLDLDSRPGRPEAGPAEGGGS